jgi:hypothetical protein
MKTYFHNQALPLPPRHTPFVFFFFFFFFFFFSQKLAIFFFFFFFFFWFFFFSRQIFFPAMTSDFAKQAEAK